MAFSPAPVAGAQFGRGNVGWCSGRGVCSALGSYVLILESVATDKVPNDDSALAMFVVFKTNKDHAMAVYAPTPSIMSVVFADLTRGDKFQIAIGADIIVPIVTLGTMKASR
jgi:hypothetical protein